MPVRGQVPRKQGLKQEHRLGWDATVLGPRASSTKTRIETSPSRLVNDACSSPRASSTKTRIETERKNLSARLLINVRGQVPRKQGLKHGLKFIPGSAGVVRGQVPRKQGLKQHTAPRYPGASRSPRASSTKTRIETLSRATPASTLFQSEGKFHENKD